MSSGKTTGGTSMYKEMTPYRCSIIRGGTSKGIFIKKNELPHDAAMRDEVIEAIFGGADIRQIDGLGGADVLTSKLAIIGPPTRKDADVDYTFGQVSFEKRFVDYGGNCGNISSAVGPYAIDEGMVEAIEPFTTVRIHCTNSGKILTAEVPVKDGKAIVNGDCQIDGVNGTGARIDMDWSDMVGSACGKLLPTGNAKDILKVDGESVEVSLVDMGNPLVFVKAATLGMEGTENVSEIEGNGKLMARIEKIRCEAAKIFGLVKSPEEATLKSPYSPFFAIVSEPSEYTTLYGKILKINDVDIVSRLLFMQKMHKTYPITGTVCTGAACRIPGTIAWECIPESHKSNKEVRIGHPSGSLSVHVSAETNNQSTKITSVKVFRTARRIMDGIVYVKKTCKGE